MTFAAGVGVGLVVGTCLGVLVAALCAAAKRGDDMIDRARQDDREHGPVERYGV